MRQAAVLLVVLAFMPIGPGQAMGGVELPHEFEALVPVHAAAEPADTRYTRDGVTVSFAVADPFARVVTFYGRALPKAGWRVVSSDATEGLAATREDIHLVLTENAGRGGFTIDLRYPGGRE
jgi:hypothetical protein